MAATQIWRASRVRAVARRGSRAGNGSAGLGRRLWTLLHAQSLINETAGSRDDVTFIEDDRRRMSGWRRN
jgi:hypothetical protein